eukprot:2449767-Prymnesium_polylepis.2
MLRRSWMGSSRVRVSGAVSCDGSKRRRGQSARWAHTDAHTRARPGAEWSRAGPERSRGAHLGGERLKRRLCRAAALLGRR